LKQRGTLEGTLREERLGVQGIWETDITTRRVLRRREELGGGKLHYRGHFKKRKGYLKEKIKNGRMGS